MSPAIYKIKPPVSAKRSERLIVGGSEKSCGLYLGKLAEAIRNQVWLDTTKEHVVVIVGKRGSGKSYTLGSIVEGFCASVDGIISRNSNDRAILLFDTLDIFWPTLYPVGESGFEEVQKQAKDLRRWKLDETPLNVAVWIPAGFRNEVIPKSFVDFYLDHRDMLAEDWAGLIGADLIQDPMGQLLNEIHSSGSQGEGPSLLDMLASMQSDEVKEHYAPETIRAVRQRLRAYSHYPLFSKGTSLIDLVKKGQLSILLLNGLPDDLRAALVSIVIRKIIRERSLASTVSKMLKLRPNIGEAERVKLETTLESGIPRTTIALDEAQNAIPTGRKTGATDLLVKLVREGRNIGTSLLITTQQPGAIDHRVMAQADILMIHKLVMQRDIDTARKHLKSRIPDQIESGYDSFQFDDLLRVLEVGQCVVSSTDTSFPGNRAIIIDVRPRVSRHGGIED
jgi:energy-coupling factor transporter ATP-binding protein EcfA2